MPLVHTSVCYARSLPAAQRAFHEWRHHGHELSFGDLRVVTCWAPHARVVPLAPVAFVLMIRVPAVVMELVPAISDVPPHGSLADRLQADRARLFLLRGCAELLPHADAQGAGCS